MTFLYLKNDVKVPSKSNNKNKNLAFSVLNVTEENSRIRTRIR
jgi:hypothetical protein